MVEDSQSIPYANETCVHELHSSVIHSLFLELPDIYPYRARYLVSSEETPHGSEDGARLNTLFSPCGPEARTGRIISV